MKKTTSIRLFFLLIVLGCCLVYGSSYYLSIQEIEQENKDFTTTDQEKEQSMESSTILPAYLYVLKEEQGYVTVFYADGETIYTITDIQVLELPQELINQLEEGKYIYTETELYNFLESYSS